MNKGFLRRGKLPFLPRVKFLRQSRRELVQVSTWLALLFLLAGQASAAYSPANPSDLLSSIKPVSPIKTLDNSIQAATTEQAPTASSNNLDSHTAIDQANRPAPEISIEITAAEYIPPVVTYTVPANSTDFPYGQCTYYVATRRHISWGGNAGAWYYTAQAAGAKVGATPAAGAIMVSFEGSSAGHVAYVESVNSDGSFTVSEMNYNGNWGRITKRTLKLGDTFIVGFIY